MPSSRGRIRLARRLVAAAGVLGLLLHVAHGQLGLGGHALDTFSDDWIYDGVILGAALSCIARGVFVPQERVPWLIIGAGLAADATGEIYYTLAFGNSGNPPTPSLADLFYLLYYPAAYVGIVLLVRSRMSRFRPSTWLDGIVAALTAGAVVSALALEPVLRSAVHGGAAEVATNLAYPICDVTLLLVVVVVLGLTGWRPGRAWLLLGIGFGLSAVADAAYLYESAQGSYVVGGLLDSLWIASALATGFAAWAPAGRRDLRLGGSLAFVIPVIAAMTSVGLLVYAGVAKVGPVAVGLAGAALALALIRTLWTYREDLRLLASVERDAVTDALTGLGNRRQMTSELAAALREGSASPVAVLAIFDLNGFKLYNDSFGHLAGDELLTHLGRRLMAAVPAGSGAFRLGGDEFCVLLRCDANDADIHIAACVEALGSEGEGFAVSTSFGKVVIPTEASTPTAALRRADERMYAQKGARAGSAREQTHGVLLGVLLEREPELHHHLREVGRLAALVGRALGMDAEQLDELQRAAELHDIGKAAVPDAILNKPAPLNEEEWQFMRRHTLVGERILAAAPALAPVARIVRASHERWDGRGYPDGLAGDAIPLGARVVFVCDAFDAMTTRRSYSEPRSGADAIAELERCAGAQFDPVVVRAFVDAWRALGADEPVLVVPAEG
jgi:diguanylate cyclase (GGDEF)-like protein